MSLPMSSVQNTRLQPCVAVVIPCYNVRNHILDVVRMIGPEVSRIYAVDDCCPEKTGEFLEQELTSERLRVVYHQENKGVGGAMITGYRAALSDGADIVVKIDGDGQMDPRLIPAFLAPITSGDADYTKGNRFYSASAVRDMPVVRMIGNAALSFMSKLSSGYWSIFDPTNGYTAVHKRALMSLDLDKVSERYFFETDMLIRLGDIRAVVVDVPMRAVYGDEESGLRIGKVLFEFSGKHIKAMFKRLVYQYFLRDFNLASLNLVTGSVLFFFGSVFGTVQWAISIQSGIEATAGTVMLAVLPIIAGLQMLLFFLSNDIASEPRRALQGQSYLSVLPSEEDERTMQMSRSEEQ